MTNRYVIKRTKMGDDDPDLLHVIRRRRKLGPKIRTRPRPQILQPSTADAVAFRIPNDKVFLLVCTVDECYATNASVVFDMVGLVAKVISKTDAPVLALPISSRCAD